MRFVLTLFLALGVLAVVGIAADDHPNTAEKKAADEISISQNVKIGGKALPTGRYRVSCNREEITFEPANGKGEKVVLPCRGKELPARAGATELHLNVQSGEAVATKLLLRGSNIEHTF